MQKMFLSIVLILASKICLSQDYSVITFDRKFNKSNIEGLVVDMFKKSKIELDEYIENSLEQSYRELMDLGPQININLIIEKISKRKVLGVIPKGLFIVTKLEAAISIGEIFTTVRSQPFSLKVSRKGKLNPIDNNMLKEKIDLFFNKNLKQGLSIIHRSTQAGINIGPANSCSDILSKI